MDDARIAEIRGRLEGIITTWPAPVVDSAMGDHYNCPMCDGDGYVDGAQFDVETLPVYVQAYGIGDEVGKHNAFIRNAPADIRDLLADNEELRSLALRQHEMLEERALCEWDADEEMPYCADCGSYGPDHTEACKFNALLSEGRKTLGVE